MKYSYFYNTAIRFWESIDSKRTFLKILLLTIVSLLTFPSLAADALLPSIMILPSDNWCTMRFFTKNYNTQDVTGNYPDYARAFQEDGELNSVISMVGDFLSEKGYGIKDAEQSIKAINRRLTEDEATYSSTSGAELAISPLDMLKMRIKSDIVIQLNWSVQKEVLAFTIEAFDAYTNKRIATSSETKKRSSKPVALQIQDLVKSHLKPFLNDMNRYFTDLKKNGRELALTIRVWDNSPVNLETEIEGKDLLSHIQYWLKDHTLNRKFVLTDCTENMAIFDQVRVPLERDGMTMDARAFLIELQKKMNKSPYNLTSKVISNGLGSATLIIGEK